MTLQNLLQAAAEAKASDLHIVVGSPPKLRINGTLQSMPGTQVIDVAMAESLAKSIVPQRSMDQLETDGEVDFAYTDPELARYRINAYRQHGGISLAIRLLPNSIPALDELGMPAIIRQFASLRSGLVLITGPTGSGKTTTLASMVDFINQNRTGHIITIEDPIEYIHPHRSGIVNQREVGRDTGSFQAALRACLREDPDVILVGEMRDPETIQIALTAAETGHLVLSSLHTTGAASTINRIIDSFPAQGQRQIRTQLAATLQGVVTQRLVVRSDQAGRLAALEIMLVNEAVRNLIREDKVHQINSAIQTSAAHGMQSMDYHLAQLCMQKVISKEQARQNCINIENLKRFLQ